VILIPGSKATIADLAHLRAQGWDIDIRAHVRRGGHVLGLCGGYQMLGTRIEDPEGLEGPPGGVDGLGLLDVTTIMTPEKRLALTTATDIATGLPVQGYEIHLGRTTGPACARPWLMIGDRPEGAQSDDGRIRGTYLHGLFAADAFRAAWLAALGHSGPVAAHAAAVDATLDALARHIEAHLDLDALLALAAPL
jgi:adenosylcobyric acid synthase